MITATSPPTSHIRFRDRFVVGSMLHTSPPGGGGGGGGCVCGSRDGEPGGGGGGSSGAVMPVLQDLVIDGDQGPSKSRTQPGEP
jgi:hypothetical protein